MMTTQAFGSSYQEHQVSPMYMRTVKNWDRKQLCKKNLFQRLDNHDL